MTARLTPDELAHIRDQWELGNLKPQSWWGKEQRDLAAILEHVAALESELAKMQDAMLGWNGEALRESERAETAWQRCPVTGEPHVWLAVGAIHYSDPEMCRECGVRQSAIAAPTEPGE